MCQCQNFIPETWQSHLLLFQAGEHMSRPHWLLSHFSFKVLKGASALRGRSGELLRKSALGFVSQLVHLLVVTPVTHFISFICEMGVMIKKYISHLRGLLWGVNQSIPKKCTEQCLEYTKCTVNISHYTSPHRWSILNFQHAENKIILEFFNVRGLLGIFSTPTFSFNKWSPGKTRAGYMLCPLLKSRPPDSYPVLTSHHCTSS